MKLCRANPSNVSAVGSLRRRTLYPAELQKHKYKAGRMILMRSALYNNPSGKKNQVLFSNKHPGENIRPAPRLLKQHRTLHPHLSLKTPSYPWFAQQVLFVDGHMEYHVVAVQLQVI